MKTRIRSLIGLTVFAVLGAAANAQPVINDDTGHYYEVFASGPITWDAAKLALESVDCLKPDGTSEPRVDLGCTTSTAKPPHLATITSSREDDFVDALRDDEVGDGMRGAAGAFPAQTWVGGIQDGPGLEPFDGWRWVNGEGNFPGVNGGTVYSNWNAAEPNESGTEDHLTLGRYGWDLGWNDEAQTRTSIVGYIAEWDVPRVLEDCEASAGGCVTIEGHTLEFEDEAIPAGTTLSFNSFEFLDPRVDVNEYLNPPTNSVMNPNFLACSGGPLSILGSTGIGPVTTHPMKIPGYLCGSPRFIIITVDTGTFFLEAGTVLVTNDTATVLPGNMYPDGGMSVCEDPIFQDPFSDGDPQYQDVVVWQTTDPDDMLEETFGPGVGGVGEFDGAAGEFTIDCGSSSRGRTKGGSDFGIGFHIDFGPGNTWAGNSAGNFDSFIALTRYKLKLLQQSVEDAFSDGALSQLAYRLMRRQLRIAVRRLDQGRYWLALFRVNVFLFLVDVANYTTITGENHNGEHQGRGENIKFMLRVKDIPYAP